MDDGPWRRDEGIELRNHRSREGHNLFRFEKLDVWHEAIALSSKVYSATRSFPPAETYGLQSQLRRAAVSVSANIAEGSGRSTDREFVRYIEIAFGSLMEVVSHLRIALLQSFIVQAESDALYADCERLGRMLSGLRNHLLRPDI